MLQRVEAHVFKEPEIIEEPPSTVNGLQNNLHVTPSADPGLQIPIEQMDYIANIFNYRIYV